MHLTLLFPELTQLYQQQTLIKKIMIKFEKVGSTTVVSQLVANDGSAVVQKFYVNQALDFHIEADNNALIFPNHEQLTKLGIRFGDLTTASATLLGSPASQQALADGIVTANLFKGYQNV